MAEQKIYNIDEIRKKILCGDTLSELKKFPDECIDCIITSPPYWKLRDYGVKGQIGLEPTLKEYLDRLFEIMKELKRVLKKTGVIFWNHGDCYGSNISAPNQPKLGKRDPYKKLTKKNRLRNKLYQKCLMLQNYRFILRCVDELGLILRNIIIWYKPNHMPSSVKDRFTNAYEPVFMLTKNKKYWFDLDAVRAPVLIKERKRGQTFYGGQKVPEKYKIWKAKNGGKNPGDVWTIATQPFPETHFATFPERLVEPMMKAGCPQWICKKCGKARERMIKTSYITTGNNINKGNLKDDLTARPYKERKEAFHQTIGWTDCGCNAGWVSGIVLDPFMGSGTTAVVAKKLGRDFVGIELNPDYVKMAEERIKNTPKPLLII